MPDSADAPLWAWSGSGRNSNGRNIPSAYSISKIQILSGNRHLAARQPRRALSGLYLPCLDKETLIKSALGGLVNKYADTSRYRPLSHPQLDHVHRQRRRPVQTSRKGLMLQQSIAPVTRAPTYLSLPSPALVETAPACDCEPRSCT